MLITASCILVLTDDVKQETASFAIGCVMELITTHCKFNIYVYIYIYIYIYIYNYFFRTQLNKFCRNLGAISKF